MSAYPPSGAGPPLLDERILPLLKAPGEGEEGGFELREEGLYCRQADRFYPHQRGVPSLLPDGEPGDVTARVRGFYEENPFPSYEGIEAFSDLVAKGRENPFSSQLLEAIGFNQTVLECGCGTGQLSHFLQLNHNHVLGVDMTLASLGLAVEHKLRNGLRRSSFAQMDLFDLAIKDDSFDVVISHAVLHHTMDAKRAFGQIVRKVRPGGVIMVGLYNRYARILTWLRSKLIHVLGPRIDYVVRERIRDPRNAEIWIRDQYFNPHETWHSVGEVLRWFDEHDVEFLNCSPRILGSSGEDAEGLFSKSDPGSAYQRAVTQLGWLGTIAREGSLFDVIGRRRGSGP